MNSSSYLQFLRFYSSKYHINSLVEFPCFKKQFVARRLQYIADSSISEGDVSTLMHFVLLSGSANIGFSSKFLYMYTSFNTFDRSITSKAGNVSGYSPEKLGVWSVLTSTDSRIEKKYSIKSPLIQSVRKLFRRSGLDFYVDQASFTINFEFRGVVNRSSWSKENEILIRFFGFPLRITN